MTTQLLSQAKQVKLALEQLKGLEKGMIQFGAFEIMEAYYFHKVLTEFKQSTHKIKIHLVDQETTALKKAFSLAQFCIEPLILFHEGYFYVKSSANIQINKIKKA
jgi:hypothetical protein